MKPTTRAFKAQSAVALRNAQLQDALGRAKSRFIDKRAHALEELPEFDALRAQAKKTKDHTLNHLDYYLERFESQVVANGGRVHWTRTPEEARRAVIDICRQADGRRVIKGKSMIGEEIALNEELAAQGMEVVETDLGEYIIQLAEEPPSHIIAPAVHKTKEEVAALFHAHHAKYGLTRRLSEIPELVTEARIVLRERFLAADVGITGANFLVAETGSTIIVTNEGNGDLSNTLPRVHVVLASIEKVVPTLEDVTTMLRLLARSATGQDFTTYTTLTSGPRRPDDRDGPEQFHVVLLDNGRSQLLGTEFQDMLRCIRCGACLNHCPVYGAVGGHAYGWVYPGPMGSVLTPLLIGLEEASALPNASTFCGRCEEVCPMHIPLPRMLRQLRVREHTEKLSAPRTRWALAAWGFLARRPVLYRWVMSAAARLLGLLGRRQGRFRKLPLAEGWTAARDFPAPQGKSFQAAWRQRQKERRE